MDKFDAPGLRALCRELDVPPEAAARCLERCAPDNEPLLRFVPALLEPSGAQAAEAELRALCGPDDGLTELAVLLTAARAARPAFARRGVPDDVYTGTMGCFARFLRETHRRTGRWAFDRGFWVWRQLCGLLLRVGTLEFERVGLPQDAADAARLSAGSPALSVHIPSDAVCTAEALHGAYRRRLAFFPDARATICRTWLLSPAVQAIVRPGSGIACFASDYALLACDPCDRSGMAWIFPDPDAPAGLLPETTSLQRGVKALAARGGCVGSALGLLAYAPEGGGEERSG